MKKISENIFTEALTGRQCSF